MEYPLRNYRPSAVEPREPSTVERLRFSYFSYAPAVRGAFANHLSAGFRVARAYGYVAHRTPGS